MPDFLRPGVFVKETLTPLPQPTLSAGEAVAAFVGTCAAGPSTPTLVQSWSDFLTYYRGFGDGTSYLPFSVYQFFQNGGRRAYIVRAVSSDATTAAVTIQNRPLLPSGSFGSGGFGSGGFGSGNSGSSSSGFSATTFSTAPPNPPTNLRLTGAPDATAISLAWDPVANADGYNIYRGLGSATPTLISPGPGQNTFFTDSPLTANSTYTYQVTAVNNIGETAKSADLTTTTPPDPTVQVPAMSVTAKSPGTFGNSIYIDILPGFTTNHFHLQVKIGGATAASVVEKFQDVSLDPSDARYVVGIVNSPSTGSQYITVANLMTGPVTLAWYPTEQVGTPLSGGYDGSQPVNLAQTITELDNINTILNVNLPGVSDTTTINAVITWCQARENAFLVVDMPQTPGSTPVQAATTYLSLVPGSSSSTGQFAVSGYAAVYGPWLHVSDPAGQSRSATRLLPPGGSVLGRYVTADTQAGPQQVAAGAQFPLLNVLDVEHLFANSQLDQLNQAGVNIIRPQNAVGLCIMGARTLNLGFPDRYIPVRRMLEYVEQVLVDATAFAVFKPNGPLLWATLDAICTTKLSSMAQLGMLAGATPNDAFFVQCDATNNTPTTVSQGQVNLTVGVALASPAEFVVINIGQYAGSTTVTNSLTPTGATL